MARRRACPEPVAALARRDALTAAWLTSGTPEQTFREEFEVLAEVTGSSQTGYALASDVREEA